MSAAPALFARLKAGTARHHRELEALIDPVKNFSSLDAYRVYLIKSRAFYHSLEDELAVFDWGALGVDFERRRKSPLLERDLLVLGMGHSLAHDAAVTPAPATLDFAVGCLYVLEGATLGGQVISRHLAKLGIGPETGGAFFHGYGAATGEMWKSFQAGASEYCASEGQICAAVDGANATFETFHETLTRAERTAV